MASWTRSNYHITLWHSKNRAQIWHQWPVWGRFFDPLDTYINTLQAKTAIRTFQERPEKKNWLGFGRMVWSQKNVEKCCKKYTTGAYNDGKTRFYETQVWAPDWNAAGKDNPVQLYVSLQDTKLSESYHQSLLIAVLDSVVQKDETACQTLCENISGILPEADCIQFKRTWAEETGEGYYSNGLQDAFGWSLFKKQTTEKSKAS